MRIASYFNQMITLGVALLSSVKVQLMTGLGIIVSLVGLVTPTYGVANGTGTSAYPSLFLLTTYETSPPSSQQGPYQGAKASRPSLPGYRLTVTNAP